MKRRYLVLLSCTAALLIAAMLSNAAYMGNVLKEKTDLYVRDVAIQSAGGLSYQLTSNLDYMEQLAETVGQMPRLIDMGGFLQRKADAFHFDLIAVVGRDGEVVKNGYESDCFDTWMDMDGRSYEKNQILSLGGHAILYSVPVPDRTGKESVLVGILEQRNMRQILTQTDFNGDGAACVVDGEGNVVIAPTDNRPFMQFLDVIQKEDDPAAAESLEKIMDEIDRKVPGMLHFSTDSREKLILSYSPLNINDWFLITLVRQDLISGDVDVYRLRSYAAAAGVFAVCAAFIGLIVSTYEKNRKRLVEITMIDPLTGDDNNLAFQMKLGALAPQSPPSTYALVFLNIKDFQLINENFGAAAGDDTLKYIHSVLKAELNEGELACRSETDHFFLCLKEASEEAVRARVGRITERVHAFNAYTDIDYRLALRAGGYLIDDPELEVRTMQDRARSACIRAQGKDVCAFFGPAMLEQARKEALLNSIFAASLDRRDFQVYLQPKVRLSDGALCGAEALVRWVHPEYGIIHPSDFIPLFERSGHICALDLYVFEEVCRLLRAYMDEGKTLVPVSVNLSRTHIKNLNFLREFAELKRTYRIPAGLIEFELTESVMLNVEQISLIRKVIGEMHRDGFLCSLDDFGFGYSSLALLKEFEIDVIKLDKSFFDDMFRPKAKSVILGFIEIAHQLEIKVVAEGIETEDQLDCLRGLNCDAVQGYVFSKPLPVDEFEAWRAERAAAD